MENLKIILKNFYEWAYWEGIMHNILFILLIFITYLLYIYKNERTVQNLLLLSIVIAIDLLIHQNINIKNKMITNYL